MKRVSTAAWRVLTSRAVTPIVIGIFLLIYIVLAFRSDEALVSLIKLTSGDPLLVALLALVPVNRGARLVRETATSLKRRKAMAGAASHVIPSPLAGGPAHQIIPPPLAGGGEGVGDGATSSMEAKGNPPSPPLSRGDYSASTSLGGSGGAGEFAERRGSALFDEEVRLPQTTPMGDQEARLASLGYRTRRTGSSLAAWRGVTAFPARFLFLLASCALFAGILLSVATRSSQRQAVVEGEPLPGGGGIVDRIVLKEEPGLLLARTLSFDVTLEGGAKRSFGLYPPARYGGFYVYPRYLGIAPLIRFAAPDLPRFESNFILMLYPPGREDAAEIPGTPYRIMMTMAPGEGGDPYVTGRIVINFRLLKDNQLVFAGSAPIGGEASGNGYRIAFPSFSRLVATDFVEDKGVMFIWTAGILFCLALLWWLPVRLLFPRQEMLFVSDGGSVVACCRAEGRNRTHLGSYHEVLDALQPEQVCE